MLVMAVVNRTPDSFYDGGAAWDEAAAMERVHQVVAEGADLVDIGGVKAGLGDDVDVSEEIRRTAGFVARCRAELPDLVISVDTWRSQVAREVCRAGADVLNDAWGGWDRRLAEVAAEYDVGLVCTHTGGAEPRSLPQRRDYADVVRDAVEMTAALAERAVALGVARDRVLVDPAHDFGKSHTPVTGDHPAPGRDDPRTVAGAGLAVAQGLRGGDARPAGRGAAHRHPRRHGGLRLARCARLPGTRRGANQAGAGHGVQHPWLEAARPPRAGRRPAAVAPPAASDLAPWFLQG